MNQGRAVFSQLISFLPDREFRRCVERYQGDSRLRGFSCWDQYLSMAFAQLTYRESLRDIEACLHSVGGKLYHLATKYQSPEPQSIRRSGRWGTERKKDAYWGAQRRGYGIFLR
jgi:Domain of unknown function (DUF4372)